MSTSEESITRSASNANMSNSNNASTKGGRKSASLPTETVEYLKAWMMSPEHVAHPYPTEQEKAQIMAETGIELKQLTNWFVNNRKRFWKPRVEAKLQSKHAPPPMAHQQQQMTTSSVGGSPQQAISPSTRRLSISLDMTKTTLPGVLQQQQQQTTTQGSFQVLSQPTFQQQQSGAPSSPHDHAVNALPHHNHVHHHPYGVDDPHTISEGSASSTCISDDDSIETSTTSGATNNASMTSLGMMRRQSFLAPIPGKSATLRREEVDVHVLRPEVCSPLEAMTNATSVNNESPGDLPTIRDLTIKMNVPKERILATFPKCQISYTVPFEIEHDRKKVQSRRDGEVLRVKKHYLKLYLATRGIHSVASPIGEPEELSTPWANNSSSSSSTKSDDVAPSNDYESSPMKGPVTEETIDNDVSSLNNSNAVSPMAASKSSSSSSSSRVRSLTCTDLDREDEITEQCSRKRARTSSGNMAKGEEEWRKACLNAKSLFCESLPGLEEAARMFGYASCQ